MARSTHRKSRASKRLSDIRATRATRRSAKLEGTLVVLGLIAGLTLGAHAVATLALKKTP